MAHARIHVLPPETLSEIFLFCLPCDDFVRISNKHAPLVLTLVCSYWRRIAIASPPLWSSRRSACSRDGCPRDEPRTSIRSCRCGTNKPAMLELV